MFERDSLVSDDTSEGTELQPCLRVPAGHTRRWEHSVQVEKLILRNLITWANSTRRPLSRVVSQPLYIPRGTDFNSSSELCFTSQVLSSLRRVPTLAKTVSGTRERLLAALHSGFVCTHPIFHASAGARSASCDSF